MSPNNRNIVLGVAADVFWVLYLHMGVILHVLGGSGYASVTSIKFSPKVKFCLKSLLMELFKVGN